MRNNDGALILSALIGGIVWRLFGRSRTANAAAFYVVLALIAVGSAGKHWKERETEAALEDFAEQNRRA